MSNDLCTEHKSEHICVKGYLNFTMFLFLLLLLLLNIVSFPGSEFATNVSGLKLTYQNLNPLVSEFKPKSTHIIIDDKKLNSPGTLNPGAPIFVPSSSPNDLTFEFNITPEVFDAMTPNNSFRENLDSITSQENPTAMIKEILFFAYMMLMNVEAESSDQDHDDSDQPQNILQSLRAKFF